MLPDWCPPWYSLCDGCLAAGSCIKASLLKTRLIAVQSMSCCDVYSVALWDIVFPRHCTPWTYIFLVQISRCANSFICREAVIMTSNPAEYGGPVWAMKELLKLTRSMLSKMEDQKRAYIAAVIQLITGAAARSVDPHILLEVLDSLKLWIMDPSVAYGKPHTDLKVLSLLWGLHSIVNSVLSSVLHFCHNISVIKMTFTWEVAIITICHSGWQISQTSVCQCWKTTCIILFLNDLLVLQRLPRTLMMASSKDAWNYCILLPQPLSVFSTCRFHLTSLPLHKIFVNLRGHIQLSSLALQSHD